MTQTTHPDKAEVIRFLLETEGRVMVCLDATFKDVEVPRRFAGDRGLMLIFNSKMPQHIEVGTDAVESELRFGGIPHYCIIPYGAIWSVFNPDTNHGMLWPESMPESIRLNQGVSMPGGTPFEKPPTMPERPSLQVIEGGAATESNAPSRSKRNKPRLRLVE